MALYWWIELLCCFSAGEEENDSADSDGLVKCVQSGTACCGLKKTMCQNSAITTTVSVGVGPVKCLLCQYLVGWGVGEGVEWRGGGREWRHRCWKDSLHTNVCPQKPDSAHKCVSTQTRQCTRASVHTNQTVHTNECPYKPVSAHKCPHKLHSECRPVSHKSDNARKPVSHKPEHARKPVSHKMHIN